MASLSRQQKACDGKSQWPRRMKKEKDWKRKEKEQKKHHVENESTPPNAGTKEIPEAAQY